MRTLIIHHNDADGIVAAWAVWKSLGGTWVKLWEADYYRKLPKVSNHEVVIVDFHCPPAELLRMASESPSVVLIDHHESAREKYDGFKCPSNVFVRIDTSHAACRLVWDHFHPGERSPWLVDAAEDYDLWRFERYGTREAMMVLYMLRGDRGWNVKDVEELARASQGQAIERGRPLLKLQDGIVKSNAARSFESVLSFGHGDHTVPVVVVNATSYPSETAEAILTTSKANGGAEVAVIWWQIAANRYRYSLRSGTVDVKAIATSMGGAGHKNAAGFETTTPLRWEPVTL